ncbi:MAG: universal stress protein [Alphaproteobacteria bacterium]|jgi:nucleotide-binding universal stress UspA family protein|nr:universal stress protein [Alphaproteobacteria bacterium]
MIRCILAATDFSERSRAALARAAGLARLAGARLVLLHVVDEDAPADIVGSRVTIAERGLAGERDRLEDVDAETRVVTGDPFAAIAATAAELEADLVVAGDHRRSLLRALFLDTTVERLVRVTALPVLIARGSATTPYVHALVGVEAEPAARVMDLLRGFGAAAPAHVSLLHAFDPVASGKMAQAGVADRTIEAYEAEVAAALRRRLEDGVEAGPSLAEIVVVAGEPVTALEQTAARLDVDLVVTATHARRGVGRLVLGSVTSRLLREGDRDLLIVPPTLFEADRIEDEGP